MDVFVDLMGQLEMPKGGEPGGVRIFGKDPVMPTTFRIGEAAAAALALGALNASAYHSIRSGKMQTIDVDTHLAAASLLGFFLQRLEGGELKRPSLENPTVTFYPCKDGRWIHLHGGFPNLEEGLLKLLDCERDTDAVAAKVAQWNAQDLEDEIAAQGLCACMVRTRDEWLAHPQGQALAAKPLVEIEKIGDTAPFAEVARGDVPDRPLTGIRVLDLTRVLAGPTCGRTLASHGAQVLNVSAEHLPSVEPFVVDTGHGKRNTFLDFREDADRQKLDDLIQGADVFCQSYRPGALAKYGLSPEQLIEKKPGLIVVSINCYGHDGPWDTRPGWEQLAQCATGIADVEAKDGVPKLLPAAATDYTTGYLAALGATVALLRRHRDGGSYRVKVSLARTGMWLFDLGMVDGAADVDFGATLEDVQSKMITTDSPFGRLVHLPPAVTMSDTPPRWDLPPEPLGHHKPEWV